MGMNRRTAMKTTGLLAASAVWASRAGRAAEAAATPYTLPPLPYAPEALEPHIDAETMRIHHGKHHAAYVKNLNDALAKHPALAGRPLEELLGDLASVPADIREAVRNNGGGHANHALFWTLLSPTPAAVPTGALADAVRRDFNTLDALTGELTRAALGRFGSGWAWLSADDAGALKVTSTPNQDTPLMAGRRPILGIDVWEHAYYLKYQNRRADCVAAILRVLDWNAVSARYAAGG
jgi:superoxide dismutase, Fe-Mn family